MTWRRPLPASVVALGVALGSALAPALVATPADATARRCVAVIVDSGSSLSSRCTDWHSGLTGLGALAATGHSFRYAPSGLLCAIDGFPADCRVDLTHYWSYWHRSAGATAWSYSQEGGGTYHPAVNSTDGWAYQNGSSRQPRNIAFGTICPAAAPAPSPTASPTPPPAPTSRPTASPTSRPTTRPTTSSTAPPPTAGHGVSPARPGSTGQASAGGRIGARATRTSGPGAPAASARPGAQGSTPAASPAGRSPVAPSSTASPAESGAAAAGSATHDTVEPSRLATSAAARTSSPPLLAAGGGVLAAAALGTLAWRRTRRRV